MTSTNQTDNSQDTQKTAKEQVSFFGKMLTFSRMKLMTDDFDIIKAQINAVSPTKDSLIPIVIDSEVTLDLKKLTDLLWDFGLQPIGVTKGKLDKQAKELRLAIFPADGKRMQRVNTSRVTTTRKVVPVAMATNNPSANNQASNNQPAPSAVKKPADKPVTASNLTKPASVNTTENTDGSDNKTTATTKLANNHSSEAPAKNQQSQQTDSNQTDSSNDKHSDKKIATTATASVKFSQEQTAEGVQAQNKQENTQDNIQNNRIDKTDDEPSNQNLDSDAPVQVIQVVEQVTSLVYDQMLRSGQSINHVGGDLILTNSVNKGAEAITDNSLHIYGHGMGRLVAGATGDQNAHIFCQQFSPSLVSVAGTYMLRDSIPPEVIDKPVQVSYKEGVGLVFRVMDDWLNQHSNQGVSSTK